MLFFYILFGVIVGCMIGEHAMKIINNALENLNVKKMSNYIALCLIILSSISGATIAREIYIRMSCCVC